MSGPVCPGCGAALADAKAACPLCRPTVVTLPEGPAAPPPPSAPARPTAASSPAALEAEQARTDPRRVLGPFVLLEELGRGGMGVVFRAWDDRLRRTVALKTLLPDTVATQERVRRFQREAEAVARLRHPHIVAIHEVGVVGDRHFISMDFLDGTTLERRLAARKGSPRLSLTKALEALSSVARAVEYAHEQGVIHRDLKPANVMLDRRDHAYVLDFGLARVRGDATVTKTGAGLGTPAYMPPEQVAEAAHVDERSDVYSLGATLYHVLTGRPPFQGETEWNVLTALVTRDPVPPSSLNKRAAGDLETICLRCLEKSPEKRYATAGELADDLDRHLAGEPIAARPLSGLERLVRRARRHRLVTALLASLALLLAAGVVLGTKAIVELDKRKREAEETARAAAAAAHQARRAAESETRAKDEAKQEARRAVRAEAEAKHALAEAHASAARRTVAEKNYPAAVRDAVEALAIESSLSELEDGEARAKHERALREYRVELAIAERGPWQGLRSLDAGDTGLDAGPVALSPRGDRLAAAGGHGSFAILDLATGRALKGDRVGGKKTTVNAIAWSPDARYVAGVANDRTLRVWDSATGKTFREVVGLESEVHAVAWHPSGAFIVTAGQESQLRVWSAPDLEPRRCVAKKEPHVTSLAFSADGGFLAVGDVAPTSSQDAVELFRTKESAPDRWEALEPIGPFHAGVDALAFDGPREDEHRPLSLAAGSNDGLIQLFELDADGRARLAGRLAGHGDVIKSLAISPDGRRLASTSMDATTRLWDVPEQLPLALRDGIEGGLAFLPSGDLALTNGVVSLWNVTRWDLRTPRLASGIHDVGISADASRFASVNDHGDLALFDAFGRRGDTLPGNGSVAYCVAFSRDGKRLASARTDAVLTLYDFSLDRGFQKLTPSPLYSLAWSPDGKLVAGGGTPDKDPQTGAEKPTLCVWDGASGELVSSCVAYPGANATIAHVDWSPDGKTLACCSNDTPEVRVFGSDLARVVATLSCRSMLGQTRLAWDAKGARLAVSGNLVDVFSLETGVRTELDRPEGAVRRGNSVSWLAAPFEDVLAVGFDRDLVLYDAVRRSILVKLPHDAVVCSAAFPPGGPPRLVAALQNEQAVVWPIAEILRAEPLDEGSRLRILDETEAAPR
jgi:WD40 repeat protein